MVIKFYKENAANLIKEYDETEEMQAKKTVQMHTLAKNILDNFNAELNSSSYQKHRTFKYDACHYAVFTEDSGQPKIVEEFFEGGFVKFVNISLMC